MRAGLRGKGFLSPEECWRLWHRTGSLNKTQNEFVKMGKINPKTGNPPTKAGIEKSAFSWAIDNQEQAKRDLTFAWQKEGFILTDQEWKVFLVKIARLVFHQRPRKFDQFISANGLSKFIDVE